MISSLTWIPKGVAASHPVRYEMSPVERELVQMMEKQQFDDEQHDTSTFEEVNSPTLNLPKTVVPESEAGANNATKPLEWPTVTADAAANLPSDLRMDEYSDDNTDDGTNDSEGNDNDEKFLSNQRQMAVGKLLLDRDQTTMSDDDCGMDAEDDDDGDDDDEDDDDGNDSNNDNDVNENYDSDEDLQNVPDTRDYTPVDVAGLQAMGLSDVGGGRKGDINLQVERPGSAEDDDSEAEDIELRPEDAMVVVAKTEDDFASLEIHVYDTILGNLYVHHDIPLPAYPLCVAQGRVAGDGVIGNFCAVGTFDPAIEIWNLDVLNALEPTCVLGGRDTSYTDDLLKQQLLLEAAKSSNGKSRAQLQALLQQQEQIQQARSKKHNKSGGGEQSREEGLRVGSHTDAVLSLSWNPIHQQVIASGSADHSVKLWDVTHQVTDASESCCSSTFRHHKDKVSCVKWHPIEGTLLATGSYDRTVCLLDARESNTNNRRSVKIQADCECVVWDPHRPEFLTVASEDGTVACWDVRKFKTSTPAWTFVANEYGGVSDLCYNAHVLGLMATCSTDKTVTLWDASSTTTKPRPVTNKDMCVGKLYSVQFYPSSPWLLGTGGSGNQLALWDLSSEEKLQLRFTSGLSTSSSNTVSLDAASDLENDLAAMCNKKELTGGNGAEVADKANASKNQGKQQKKRVHRKGR